MEIAIVKKECVFISNNNLWKGYDMKKLFCATLASCILVTLCQAEFNTRRLEDAIEKSDLARVKALLKKLDKEEMTPQARKKMLENLYDIAEDVSQERTTGLSSTGGWLATMRKVVGVLNGLSATLSFVDAAVTKEPSKAIPGVISCSLAAYLLSKKGDWRDTLGAMFVAGAVRNSISAAVNRNQALAVGALIGGTLGGYLLYSGHIVQKTPVIQARTVQKYLKDKLNNVEVGIERDKDKSDE